MELFEYDCIHLEENNAVFGMKSNLVVILSTRVSAKDILHHERYEADEGQSFQANQALPGASVGSRASTGSRDQDPKPHTSKEPEKHRHHHAHHNQVLLNNLCFFC